MSTNNSDIVAILGAGPSGLVAAQAAILAGYRVHIYTAPDRDGKPKKSDLYGCQYLHAPIPGTSVRSATVDYKLVGTADDYRRKVYGPDSDVEVSVETLTNSHQAWDIRATYDSLWDIHVSLGNSKVFARTLDPTAVRSIYHRYEAVISTIPAPSVCRVPGHHRFDASHAYAIGDAPALGRYAPVEVEPNTVICNGAVSLNWYRAANVFGHTTVEWPGQFAYAYRRPARAVLIKKPLSTNCDCFRGMLRAGRFAEWKKGVLVHETFDKVKGYLKCLS